MNKNHLNEDARDNSSEETGNTSQSNFKKTLFAIFDFLKTTIIVVFLALIIRVFIIQPFIVEGQSMLPTFNNNDYLITEKISYSLRSPNRGEIIIFHPPDNPNVNYIKRIIGLPGDKIEIKDGNIYINSTKINESYLASDSQTNTVSQDINITLKDNEYFVLGDNRNHSRDSREIGPVPRSNIVSKIWVRLLPLDNASAFAAVKYEGLDY